MVRCRGLMPGVIAGDISSPLSRCVLGRPRADFRRHGSRRRPGPGVRRLRADGSARTAREKAAIGHLCGRRDGAGAFAGKSGLPEMLYLFVLMRLLEANRCHFARSCAGTTTGVDQTAGYACPHMRGQADVRDRRIASDAHARRSPMPGLLAVVAAYAFRPPQDSPATMP